MPSKWSNAPSAMASRIFRSAMKCHSSIVPVYRLGFGELSALNENRRFANRLGSITGGVPSHWRRSSGDHPSIDVRTSQFQRAIHNASEGIDRRCHAGGKSDLHTRPVHLEMTDDPCAANQSGSRRTRNRPRGPDNDVFPLGTANRERARQRKPRVGRRRDARLDGTFSSSASSESSSRRGCGGRRRWQSPARKGGRSPNRDPPQRSPLLRSKRCLVGFG